MTAHPPGPGRLLRRALACLIALTLPAAASAEEAPRLLFPVACTLGETCFLQQFVDRDPGPGARAFDCGPQSYDGHTGTDIRTADMAAMLAGVTVIAAADGVVRALRDGIPDGGTATAPAGQGCGNGVVLSHPGGWETQYCHLMQGSLSVTEGQTVTAGTALGRIGYSGTTEFPHLEFLVRQGDRVVDPFAPSDLATCGTATPALWADPVPNPGGGILSLGFSTGIPAYDQITAGAAGTGAVTAGAEALVLWAFVHGGRVGDVLRLRITDATGADLHMQEVTLDRTQAQLFRASGRRRPAGGWPPGLYDGHVTLLRDGRELDRAQVAVIVLP